MIQNPIAVLTHQATTVHLKETANARKLSIFTLQINGDQAAGNMERGRCWYGVTLTRT